MADPVIHQQIYKPGAFGGVVNTTICARVDNSIQDANKDATGVTCKFCLRIIEQGKNPRLKWIGWEPKT